jgi:hypothetical protein
VGLVQSLNPLRLTGHSLPIPLVLAARLLAAFMLIRGEKPFPVYLPYLELLDWAPGAAGFVLRRVAEAGSVLVLFSPFVRTGAGLAGAAHLLGLLACRPCHSVAHTFVACVFIALALESHTTRGWVLRGQVVVLYAGAGLHKAVDPDWWNGRYFDALMIGRHQFAWYHELGSWFPDGALSTAFGITTIVTQFALAACLILPRGWRVGLALGVLFHLSMTVMMQSTFGPFLGTIFIAYLAFVRGDASGIRRPATIQPAMG